MAWQEDGGLLVRAGNGMTLRRAEEMTGGGILGVRGRIPDVDEEEIGYPPSLLPYVENGFFRFNLVPVREFPAPSDNGGLILQNTKAYIRMVMTPHTYSSGGTYALDYASVVSLALVTAPHGVIPPTVLATIDGSSGATTDGVIYWYCAKLFADGSRIGFGGGDGLADIDYEYPKIVSFGATGGGNHFPQVVVF